MGDGLCFVLLVVKVEPLDQGLGAGKRLTHEFDLASLLGVLKPESFELGLVLLRLSYQIAVDYLKVAFLTNQGVEQFWSHRSTLDAASTAL